MRCEACSMPKGHGCHPDKHVMGLLSCVDQFLKNPVNKISRSSSLPEPGVSDAMALAPGQLAGKRCVAVWRSLRPMPLLPSLSRERAACPGAV